VVVPELNDPVAAAMPTPAPAAAATATITTVVVPIAAPAPAPAAAPAAPAPAAALPAPLQGPPTCFTSVTLMTWVAPFGGVAFGTIDPVICTRCPVLSCRPEVAL